MNDPSAPVVAVAKALAPVAPFASRRASSPGASQGTAETVTPAAGRSPRSDTSSRPRISPAAAGRASARGRTRPARRPGRNALTVTLKEKPPRRIDPTGTGPRLSSNPFASEQPCHGAPARASQSDARARRKVTHQDAPRAARHGKLTADAVRNAHLRSARRPHPAHVGRAARLRARGEALGACGRRFRKRNSDGEFCGRKKEKDFLEGAWKGCGRPLRRAAAPTLRSHSKKIFGGHTKRISSAARSPVRSRSRSTSHRPASRRVLIPPSPSYFQRNLLPLLLFSPSSRARSSRRRPPSSSAGAVADAAREGGRRAAGRIVVRGLRREQVGARRGGAPRGVWASSATEPLRVAPRRTLASVRDLAVREDAARFGIFVRRRRLDRARVKYRIDLSREALRAIDARAAQQRSARPARSGRCALAARRLPGRVSRGQHRGPGDPDAVARVVGGLSSQERRTARCVS